MRLLRRKKKKEWFNQKLIHAAKIQHLIRQSQIDITFGVIGFAVIHEVVITFGVITTCRVIRSAVIHKVVLVNNSVDMCEFHFRRRAS
jgi:hypothetical protein